jgi:hypothetical protein
MINPLSLNSTTPGVRPYGTGSTSLGATDLASLLSGRAASQGNVTTRVVNGFSPDWRNTGVTPVLSPSARPEAAPSQYRSLFNPVQSDGMYRPTPAPQRNTTNLAKTFKLIAQILLLQSLRHISQPKPPSNLDDILFPPKSPITKPSPLYPTSNPTSVVSNSPLLKNTFFVESFNTMFGTRPTAADIQLFVALNDAPSKNETITAVGRAAQKKGETSQDIIKGLYRLMLGREARKEAIDNGALFLDDKTRKDAVADYVDNIIASQEYKNKTDMVGNATFVKAFKAAYGREAETADLNVFIDLTSQSKPQEITAKVLKEARNSGKTNDELIAALFKTVWDRAATDAEKQAITKILGDNAKADPITEAVNSVYDDFNKKSAPAPAPAAEKAAPAK